MARHLSPEQKASRRRRRRIFKKTTHYIGNVLVYVSLAFLCICLIIAVHFRDDPSNAYVFGYRPVFVKTGSMEPVIHVNGMLIVQQIDYDDVKKDDIIMYENGDKVITHRVIDITDEGIQTKGDNNNAADAYLLTKENVKAKVVQIWNWTCIPLNDICPEGYGESISWPGVAKWVGLPLGAMLGIEVLIAVLKKGDDDDEDEYEAVPVKVQKSAAPSVSANPEPVDDALDSEDDDGLNELAELEIGLQEEEDEPEPVRPKPVVKKKSVRSLIQTDAPAESPESEEIPFDAPEPSAVKAAGEKDETKNTVSVKKKAAPKQTDESCKGRTKTAASAEVGKPGTKKSDSERKKTTEPVKPKETKKKDSAPDTETAKEPDRKPSGSKKKKKAAANRPSPASDSQSEFNETTNGSVRTVKESAATNSRSDSGQTKNAEPARSAADEDPFASLFDDMDFLMTDNDQSDYSGKKDEPALKPSEKASSRPAEPQSEEVQSAASRTTGSDSTPSSVSQPAAPKKKKRKKKKKKPAVTQQNDSSQNASASDSIDAFDDLFGDLL